jgi:hypothetical protein
VYLHNGYWVYFVVIYKKNLTILVVSTFSKFLECQQIKKAISLAGAKTCQN